MYFGVIRNPLLRVKKEEHFDEVWQNGSIVDPSQMRIVSSENWSRFFQVIVRDFREQMVDLVSSNIVHQVMGPTVMAIHWA